MPVIPLPQPEVPDIYSYGFDVNLNRAIRGERNPAVYDIIADQVSANLMSGGLETAAGKNLISGLELPIGRHSIVENFRGRTDQFTGGNSSTSAMTIVLDADGINILSGTGTASNAARTIVDAWGSTLEVFNRNPVISTHARLSTISAANTKRGYVVIGNVGANADELTNKHFGFEVSNNNGTGQVFATNADGVTRSITLLPEISATAKNEHTAVMRSGQDIRFYVNGNLAATHTENLPKGTLPSITSVQIAFRNTGGTADTKLVVANLSASIESQIK